VKLHCSKCKLKLDSTSFYKDVTSGTGHLSSCKACGRKRLGQKERQYSVVEDGLKHCLTCGTYKLIDSFYKDSRRAEGRGSLCKACLTVKRGSRTRVAVNLENGKFCSKCKETRTLEYFKPEPSNTTGYHKACTVCTTGQEIPVVNRKKSSSTHKHCNTCDRYRRRDAFKVESSNTTGLAACCRECMQAPDAKAKQAEYNADRRARKLKAVPGWTTGEDRKKMKALYAEAAYMRSGGEDVVVDHILPLNGKTVSGLHIWYNLKIRDRLENLKKSNKLPREEDYRYV